MLSNPEANQQPNDRVAGTTMSTSATVTEPENLYSEQGDDILDCRTTMPVDASYFDRFEAIAGLQSICSDVYKVFDLEERERGVLNKMAFIQGEVKKDQPDIPRILPEETS